ncbi:unnamed protein product [Ixodes persulcatus]
MERRASLRVDPAIVDPARCLRGMHEKGTIKPPMWRRKAGRCLNVSKFKHSHERKHAPGVSEVFPTRFCYPQKRNGGSDEMPHRSRADGVKYAPRFILFIDFRNLSLTSFGRSARSAFEKNNGSKCIFIYIYMYVCIYRAGTFYPRIFRHG